MHRLQPTVTAALVLILIGTGLAWPFSKEDEADPKYFSELRKTVADAALESLKLENAPGKDVPDDGRRARHIYGTLVEAYKGSSWGVLTYINDTDDSVEEKRVYISFEGPCNASAPPTECAFTGGALSHTVYIQTVPSNAPRRDIAVCNIVFILSDKHIHPTALNAIAELHLAANKVLHYCIPLLEFQDPGSGVLRSGRYFKYDISRPLPDSAATPPFAKLPAFMGEQPSEYPTRGPLSVPPLVIVMFHPGWVGSCFEAGGALLVTYSRPLEPKYDLWVLPHASSL